MIIDKIETNIKRNLFLNEIPNIKLRSSDIYEDNTITINATSKFQEFIGFGGAFTESAGYALSTINSDIYNNILDDYFSKEGLNYNFGRLPIASNDFSLKSYSYSYKKDLSDFSIEQDTKYIIPTIKSALKRNKNIKFISSPWSPPAFMKSNKMLILGGKNLLINYLYPTFKENNLNTKFLIWDHNKDDIVERVNDCLLKYGAIDYADGIAFHWYTGSYFENLNTLNKSFPDKLLIHTEGCTGYSNFKPEDELFNAEMYATEIIGDLNNGTNCFVDWNLVLDYSGGPNHKKNYCNSPIMINKNKDGYIKTPSFYYIGQFSKYIKPNSRRIDINNPYKDIQITAFKNIDRTIAVILFNKNNFNIEYNFSYENCIFHDNLDSHAIVTLVIKQD